MCTGQQYRVESSLMATLQLNQDQNRLVDLPVQSKIFLEGPAGSGKTTAAVERVLALMARSVPGGDIILFVPQRTLAAPYYEALRTPGVVAGGMVTVLTIGGLAQRMVELYWPLAAEEAGFAHPDHPPTFLTLESAQYYMAHVARPLLDEGLFDSVVINRNRLYSQVLDNLNKAAVVGFPHTEIGSRLQGAWSGDLSQARIFDDAQTCASRFRAFCLEHNLLDFSLQVEVFLHHLWPLPLVRENLLAIYRHLVVDNLEEDVPVAHDIYRQWLDHCASALLIYDTEAGYRGFLGADPDSAYTLKELCEEKLVFRGSFVASEPVRALQHSLAKALGTNQAKDVSTTETNPAAAVKFEGQRFFPQMLDWVTGQIVQLVVQEAVPPGEIVVLAPFLSDALRFALTNRLERSGVPTRSHRPSRALRDEPVTQCLLTLARLAHPDWGFQPAKFDVAYALVQAIEGLDLVRARLLTDNVYALSGGEPVLKSFDQLKAHTQARVTYQIGERYEHLRVWLAEYTQSSPEELDHFLSRLFGEVLSQPGFGFHADYQAGEVAANLIESLQKFRWAAGDVLASEGLALGKEYLQMVDEGVIAAQYIRSWREQPAEAVLLAPAYTFLLSNHPVDYQFWLDTGSRGWFERLYQPLTHPYVLSRQWPAGQVWSDEHEYQLSRQSLYRLALGLLRRCRHGIYLGISELNEQGFEARGPLYTAFQRVRREASLREAQ